MDLQSSSAKENKIQVEASMKLQGYSVVRNLDSFYKNLINFNILV